MAGIYNASAKGTDKKTGKINNATLPDGGVYIQAGIDTKTGLPLKMSNSGLKPNCKKLLRIIDEQDAINSVRWYNLPNGLDGNLMERIVYYRGQGMFFYMETDNKFYFLPYALDGTIDVYGRFVDVTPVPFNGSATADSGDGKVKPWITGLRRHCVYDILLDEVDLNKMKESCVLLHDYSQQQSQTITPRQVLNDPLIDIMSDCIPFMRTSLLNSTGVMGMRVQSEDEQSNVEAASRSINRAAIEGKKYVPIIGGVDFQDLTGGEVAKSEEFLLAMQSLDNIRLGTHGLDNGGIFQKQAHVLQSEQALNTGSANMVMQDRQARRQHFCDIVNSIWGLGIWCEVGEATMQMGDYDMDGSMYENDPESVSYASDIEGESDNADM